MLLHWQFLGSKIIVNLKKCYFTIHCEEEEVLCLISCRRSGVGGGGAWFKERQFWQKYVHKGKKSFWCLATCHSKVGLKSSSLHREKKTSQKVSTIFPFWNTSPKLRFLHWNSYLTKCKCRPTDTRIFLLHIRNRQNLTIFFFNLYNLVNFRYLLISKQKIESEKSWPYSAWIQKRHIFNFHIV